MCHVEFGMFCECRAFVHRTESDLFFFSFIALFLLTRSRGYNGYMTQCVLPPCQQALDAKHYDTSYSTSQPSRYTRMFSLWFLQSWYRIFFISLKMCQSHRHTFTCPINVSVLHNVCIMTILIYSVHIVYTDVYDDRTIIDFGLKRSKP